MPPRTSAGYALVNAAIEKMRRAEERADELLGAIVTEEIEGRQFAVKALRSGRHGIRRFYFIDGRKCTGRVLYDTLRELPG